MYCLFGCHGYLGEMKFDIRLFDWISSLDDKYELICKGAWQNWAECCKRETCKKQNKTHTKTKTKEKTKQNKWVHTFKFLNLLIFVNFEMFSFHIIRNC